jgi:tetratricopeptide (TPR) repeat protein
MCPNCSFDIVIFTKAVKVSNTLYNQGLAKAQAHDMSGATECLRKCVELNKNNVTARNLLGLVYFETGRAGEAMRQWAISAALSPFNQTQPGQTQLGQTRPETDESFPASDNPASDYLKQVRGNALLRDKLTNAARLYNQALNFLEQKSEDMARIQLKKATDLNPSFVDALNLLSLCYLAQNDQEKAAATLERVLAIDVRNPAALCYKSELNPSKLRPEILRLGKSQSSGVGVVQSGLKKLSPKERKGLSASFPITEVISFAIGGLAALAVLYQLILPSQIAVKQEQIELLDKEKNAQIQALQSQLALAEDEMIRLDTAYQESEAKSRQQTIQIDLLEKTGKVEEAQIKFDNKLYKEALDVLATVDPTGLPSDIIEHMQTIRDASYPPLLTQFYQAGRTEYNRNRWDSALEAFESALSYLQPQNNQSADVLYYLGRTLERLNNKEEARRYYQKIVDEYPKSAQVRNANTRLRQLG